MDIPRKSRKLRKVITRLAIAAAILAIAGAASFYASKMEPAAPKVDGAMLYTDTVKRGSMSRAVRGMGKLVPEEIRWIQSTVAGLVERKLLEPGASVTPDTVIVELSNPQLERDVITAEWDMEAAEKSFAVFQLTLQLNELTQAADMIRLESDYELALARYESNLILSKDGLVQHLELRQEEVSVEQLANRIELEKQRAVISRESSAAQLVERRTSLEKTRAMYEQRKSQLDALNVKVGYAGILQELPLEIGQNIGVGTNVARLVNPNRLKAELSVSETQAKDIQIGMSVSVDTRNGVTEGVISRIDPAVKGGSVTMDVKFTEELPAGSRPDLSVDGTIVLERLEDVVYMPMPANAQANSQASVFRVSADGKTAERVNARLGRSSVNTVEVLEGLEPGDRIILSDMSAHDGVDLIRLNF